MASRHIYYARRVHKNALAADRTQVVAVRILLGMFCYPLKFAGVKFDPENVCSNVSGVLRLGIVQGI